MTTDQWLIASASFIGGGAIGALINSIAKTIRNRQQPIGKRVEIIRLFKNNLGNSTINIKITVKDSGNIFNYSNLYVADILIANKGNMDFESFDIGLTTGVNEQIIYAHVENPDRHHTLTNLTTLSPSEPKNEIDLKAEPFNRGDNYNIRLFITIPDENALPSDIQFSSPHPIRFTEMPTISEIITDVAKSTALSIGPIVISTRIRKNY